MGDKEMFEKIVIEFVPHMLQETTTIKVVKYENYVAKSQDTEKLVKAITKGFKKVELK